jgi:hypothetical protein
MSVRRTALKRRNISGWSISLSRLFGGRGWLSEQGYRKRKPSESGLCPLFLFALTQGCLDFSIAE